MEQVVSTSARNLCFRSIPKRPLKLLRHVHRCFVACQWFNASTAVDQTRRLKEKKKEACVRERTIPTKRPQLIGEDSANVLRIEGETWSAAVFSSF
jgi:hypothetical protein